MIRTSPTADAILTAYIAVVGFTTTGIVAVGTVEKNVLIVLVGIGFGALWGMIGVAFAAVLWAKGVAHESGGLSTDGHD